MNIKSISKHLKAHPRDRVALTDNVYIVNTYTYDKEGTVTEAGQDITAKMVDSRLEARKFVGHDEFELVSHTKITELANVIELFEALQKVSPKVEPKTVKIDEIEAVDDKPIGLNDIPF